MSCSVLLLLNNSDTYLGMVQGKHVFQDDGYRIIGTIQGQGNAVNDMRSGVPMSQYTIVLNIVMSADRCSTENVTESLGFSNAMGKFKVKHLQLTSTEEQGGFHKCRQFFPPFPPGPSANS